MNDLISRQALCEYALNQKDKSVTPNDIMRFPSAGQEIIRCKDCKHYKTKQGHLPWENSRRYCNRSVTLATNPDDFCSRAERRQDDNHK